MSADAKIKSVTETGLRESLINSGVGIIKEKGLSSLTLRAVARASGVSHMAPYSHFDDKDSLLAAIAENGFKELAMVMQEARDAHSVPFERLLHVGMSYVIYACQKPSLFQLMFSSGITHRHKFEALTEAGQCAFSVCRSCVADYVADENLTDEVLQLRALAMWSLVHGLSSLLIDNHIDAPDKSPAAIEPLVLAILSQVRI